MVFDADDNFHSVIGCRVRCFRVKENGLAHRVFVRLSKKYENDERLDYLNVHSDGAIYAATKIRVIASGAPLVNTFNVMRLRDAEAAVAAEEALEKWLNDNG